MNLLIRIAPVLLLVACARCDDRPAQLLSESPPSAPLVEEPVRKEPSRDEPIPDTPRSKDALVPITVATRCPPAPSPVKPTLNPCDPTWQRGRYQGKFKDVGQEMRNHLQEFEGVLAQDRGVRWIGNETVSPPDYRAIVQVDVYAAGKGCPVERGAWYLADVPINSKVLGQIKVPRFKDPPIAWTVVGYCFSDHSFRASPEIPDDCKYKPAVEYVVIKYDPRCVCAGIEIDGVVEVQ